MPVLFSMKVQFDIRFNISFHFVVYCLPSVMWWFQDSAETADPHDGAQKKSIKYTNAKHNKKKLKKKKAEIKTRKKIRKK